MVAYRIEQIGAIGQLRRSPLVDFQKNLIVQMELRAIEMESSIELFDKIEEELDGDRPSGDKHRRCVGVQVCCIVLEAFDEIEPRAIIVVGIE